MIPGVAEFSRPAGSDSSATMRASMSEPALLTPTAQQAPLLLYDGDCALCSRSVKWVLARDPGGALRFAPLQGQTARPVLLRLGRDPDAPDLDTVLLVLDPGGPGERALERSSAAVGLLRYLGGRWRVLGSLLWLVPRPLRNLGYRLVARNRKKLVAGPATCPVPPAGERKRFLP